MARKKERNLPDPLQRTPKMKEGTLHGEMLISYSEGLRLLTVTTLQLVGIRPSCPPTGLGHPVKDKTILLIDPRGKSAMGLAEFSGLRLGEVCGVRWEHLYRLDGPAAPETGPLMLRSCTNIHTGATTSKAPKWKSYRDVSALPEAETVLDEVAWRSPFSRKGLILTNWSLSCEVPMNERTISHHLEAILAAAKVDRRITFHDLRHYYTSYCRKMGMPIGDVTALLGH